MTWTTERILIWGKTYPELSATYTETVCTAGVRESGEPVRLYPLPLRYMENDQRFKLYDWVTVPTAKSTKDTRFESYKVEHARLKRVGNVQPDDMEWAERRQWIFKDPSWQYEAVSDLVQAARTTRRSLGIIRPGSIEDIVLEPKTAEESTEFERKRTEVGQQGDLFIEKDLKELRFRPYRIVLKWRCPGVCTQCRNQPHRMQVLDWGLFQLAQKHSYEKALERLRTIVNQQEYDFHLFLGNTKAHQHNFLVVGLWYPKRRPQGVLL